MGKVSFIDNIKVLVDMISSSFFFVLILLMMIVLAYLFITMTKKNRNQMMEAYLFIFVIGLLILLLQYGSSFGKLFDYFMDHVFVVIYFPNLAIYVLAIIISNIMMWRSVFFFKTKNIIKIVNCVCYFIIHYLFILILSSVSTQQLDIFRESAIYQNKELLSLIELSSIIFILWMLFLLIFHLITKYLMKMQKSHGEVITLEEKPSQSKEVCNHQDNIVKTQSVSEPFTLEEYRLLAKILKKEKTDKKE